MSFILFTDISVHRQWRRPLSQILYDLLGFGGLRTNLLVSWKKNSPPNYGLLSSCYIYGPADYRVEDDPDKYTPRSPAAGIPNPQFQILCLILCTENTTKSITSAFKFPRPFKNSGNYVTALL